MYHVISYGGRSFLFNGKEVKIYALPAELAHTLRGLSDLELTALASEVEKSMPVSDEHSAFRQSPGDSVSKLQGDAVSRKEKSQQGAHLSRLVLVISQGCNMACRYCYAGQGMYGAHECKLMDAPTLKNAVDRMYAKFSEGIRFIQFFGGEPLLNYQLIKQTVPWIMERAKTFGCKPSQLGIVTNGTLITPEMEDFFNTYGMSVTVSLDGAREVNDVNRIYRDGTGTYDDVVRRIGMMNERRKHPLFIEMTLTDEVLGRFGGTETELPDIQALRQLHTDGIYVSPMLSAKRRSDEDQHIEELTAYFTALYGSAIFEHEGELVTDLLAVSENVRSLMCGGARVQQPCQAGISEFSIAPGGDIYPCYMFFGHTEWLLGNVNQKEPDSFHSSAEKMRKKLSDNTFANMEKCASCWLNRVCHGCIGMSYQRFGRIDVPLREACADTKPAMEAAIYLAAMKSFDARKGKTVRL